MAQITPASITTRLSRRRVLAIGGTLAAAGAGYTHLNQPARAAVTVDEFGVSTTTITAESPTIVATLSAAYDYDVGASTAVTGVRFAFDIDGTEVATETLRTDTTAHEGTQTLEATVTESDAWTASDFAPDVGSEVSREVSATVRFTVLGEDDSTLASASQTDTATITVSHPQESTYVADVGGTVTFATAEA